MFEKIEIVWLCPTLGDLDKYGQLCSNDQCLFIVKC